MADGLDDECDRGYAAKLGARLRSLRRQQQLSLQDVEAISDDEFKASVLGAYERGERNISVPRLQRLARLYRVPVDQIVPRGDELDMPSSGGDEQHGELTAGTAGANNHDRAVTIDLGAVGALAGRRGEMLARYLRTIEVQRGDYNGRVLTVRRQDLTALACILDCRFDQVAAQLDNLGLRAAY